MFDLDARVHLHEVVRAVLVEQHLHGARAEIADRLRAEHGGVAHLLAQRRRHGRARRLFNQLLVASLDGAVALAEVDAVAVRVAEDLELDVARPLEVFLDVDGAVAERGERLGARHLEAARELLGVARDAHPLSAAAGRGLDDHRESDLDRVGECVLDVIHGARGAGHDGDAVRDHRGAGGGLVSHRPDLFRRGADERDLARGADLGELGILGEETVAGMNRVGSGDLGGRDDARDLQVALARRRGADADVVVGEADVQRLAVGLGVDGDGLDAELAARADDAQRDLAAIGDENLLKHRVRKSPTFGWRSGSSYPSVG